RPRSSGRTRRSTAPSDGSRCSSPSDAPTTAGGTTGARTTPHRRPIGHNAGMAPASDPLPPREVVRYGPEIPDEDGLRLLGSVTDKRVLVLGLHRPSASIALAQQGAKVVVVDPDGERLDRGRAACEEVEAKAEFRKADLAGL